MGITKASVTVVGESQSTQLELIVDAGSILTWIKSGSLTALGNKAKREKEFRTIEGKTIRRWTGPATIKYDGVEADVEVVFGEKTDAEVLGVTALGSLGLQVDPVTLELHRSSLLAL